MATKKPKTEVFEITEDAKVLIGYAIRERDMAMNKMNDAVRRCGRMSGVPKDADPACVAYDHGTGMFTVSEKPRGAKPGADDF